MQQQVDRRSTGHEKNLLGRWEMSSQAVLYASISVDIKVNLNVTAGMTHSVVFAVDLQQNWQISKDSPPSNVPRQRDRIFYHGRKFLETEVTQPRRKN